MMLNNSGVMDGVHEVAVEAQRGGSHHQRGLKKRPWTKEEDAILIEYVNKHGAGNWSEVPKFNSRLARSSRSCRLRWLNHLKPGLKKGPFSPEEEILIINLQAKHGNKWAYIASQLPGRTDNEIKNYWNTRMKHLQRAALPVYPHDHITSTFSSTSDHQNPNNNYSFQNHHHNSSSLYSNPMTQFHGNDGFAMPLFPVSSFGSSALLNESNIPNQTLIGPYNPHGGFGGYNNISLSPMIMGPPTYDPTPSVQGSNPELTSNQTPLSMNAGDKGQMGGSGYAANEDHYEIVPVQSQGYCGLLDDVLLEAQNIPTKKDKSGVSYSSGWSGKEKDVMVEEEDPVEEFDYECLVSLLNSPSTIPALSE